MKKKLYIMIFTSLGFLIVATVFFAMKASSQGENLISLEEKAAQLAEKNDELNNQIVGSSSLTQISEKAKNMGYGTPGDFVYMNGTGVAMR